MHERLSVQNCDMSMRQIIGMLSGAISSAKLKDVHADYLAEVTHEAVGVTTVRLKPLSRKRIANELLAANLADSLGVRTPTCFVVEVGKGIAGVQHYVGEVGYCRFRGCPQCQNAKAV